MKYQILRCGAGMVISLLMGLGCSTDGGVGGAAFSVGISSLPAIAGDPMSEGPFTQAASPWNGNVDVLFMLDTSLSLTDADRANFSANLPPLIHELTDVNSIAIGFGLDWGNPGSFFDTGTFGSPGFVPGYNGSGSLFNYKGVNASGYVTIGDPSAPADRAALQGAIEGTFAATPPVDTQAAGGEVGTYSFNRMMTQTALTAAAGDLLRPATPLMVVFVSDENDVCDPRPLGGRPTMDSTDTEYDAYIRYCVDDVGNPKDLMGSMYTAAKAITAPAPVQFSSIINPRGYVNPKPFDPADSSTQKETGFGYLEATEMTNGVVVPVESDFSTGLKNLGNAINALAANIQRTFVLHPPAGKLVNPNSIRAMVNDLQVTSRFNSATNTVILDYAGHAGDTVVIHYRVVAAN